MDAMAVLARTAPPPPLAAARRSSAAFQTSASLSFPLSSSRARGRGHGSLSIGGGGRAGRTTRTRIFLPRLVAALEEVEETYIMVKPDGVQRGLVGEIISRFEKKGFLLKGLKLFQCPKDLAEVGDHGIREIAATAASQLDFKERPWDAFVL